MYAAPDTTVSPGERADARWSRLRRWFLASHVVVGMLALALAVWVQQTVAELTPAYWLFLALATSLLLQPVLLRLTGAYNLLTIMSVLLLNAMIMVAVYNYGGHLSPILPISIVVPIFCLFFLTGLGQAVGLISLAFVYGALITLFVSGHAFPQHLPQADLSGLFLTSVIISAVLVTLLGRAYLNLYALSRDTLRQEIARHRDTADNLAKARNLVENATKSKGKTIAAMCDELRMPLNAIIGFSQIISRELMGQLDDDRYRSCASDIESSGRHLLGIIDEVLDLARVESGDLELVDGEFELAQLLTKCRETVAGVAKAREVELVEAMPEGGIMVRADHGRIRQVVIALLTNCTALVGSGGRVHIQLSKTAAHEAMILIRATGSTVSPERMALALQPFEGIPSGHGADRLGIGYGLPIARRLVELHGGKLEVAGPRPDETHIILTLPQDRML